MPRDAFLCRVPQKRSTPKETPVLSILRAHSRACGSPSIKVKRNNQNWAPTKETELERRVKNFIHLSLADCLHHCEMLVNENSRHVLVFLGTNCTRVPSEPADSLPLCCFPVKKLSFSRLSFLGQWAPVPMTPPFFSLSLLPRCKLVRAAVRVCYRQSGMWEERASKSTTMTNQASAFSEPYDRFPSPPVFGYCHSPLDCRSDIKETKIIVCFSSTGDMEATHSFIQNRKRDRERAT